MELTDLDFLLNCPIFKKAEIKQLKEELESYEDLKDAEELKNLLKSERLKLNKLKNECELNDPCLELAKNKYQKIAKQLDDMLNEGNIEERIKKRKDISNKIKDLSN